MNLISIAPVLAIPHVNAKPFLNPNGIDKTKSQFLGKFQPPSQETGRFRGRDSRWLPLLLASLSILAQSSATVAESTSPNWPNFRGPGGYGHASNANPPLEWNAESGRNILWKTEVPLHGASSPVVWGSRVFVTGADELAREVYCYDTNTGELLWKHEAKDIEGSPNEEQLPRVMEETGYAAPTATTNGKHIAAIFGTGDLVCLTMEGKRVWAKNLGIPLNHYGHASSLISDGNLLFVQFDQKEGSKLFAFDFESGEIAWQVERGEISWSSPLLVDNHGRQELILVNSKTVESHDPKSGRKLWSVECLDGEVATSAAYASGIVGVANEYATAAAIDISEHNAEPKILWRWDEVLPDSSSPVANETFVIVPSSFGAVTCLEIKTGAVLWDHDFDMGSSSSPVLVGNRVYLADYSGNFQIFGMASKFELLGTANVGEDVFATPAFVGDRIYIRGARHLFCVEAKE